VTTDPNERCGMRSTRTTRHSDYTARSRNRRRCLPNLADPAALARRCQKQEAEREKCESKPMLLPPEATDGAAVAASELQPVALTEPPAADQGAERPVVCPELSLFLGIGSLGRRSLDYADDLLGSARPRR